MTDKSNRWGGGAVHCFGCCSDTPTPAYVGRLRCCKTRIGLCQECKTQLPLAGFKSPAHAAKIWSKSHAEHCEQSISARADAEAEKWSPKAKELYVLLATELGDFVKEHGLPVHGAETALILLSRGFCNSTGTPPSSFAQNFLDGMDLLKNKVKVEDAAAAADAEPNLDWN